jgi:hypothetical protein
MACLSARLNNISLGSSHVQTSNVLSFPYLIKYSYFVRTRRCFGQDIVDSAINIFNIFLKLMYLMTVKTLSALNMTENQIYAGIYMNITTCF